MISPITAPRTAANFASNEVRTRRGGWKTWGIGLLIAALIGGVCQAAPVTLYDSIGSNTANGHTPADGSSWLANQFLTDAQSYTLDSVVMSLYQAPQNGTVQLDLYSDNSGVPGSSLGTFNAPGSFAAGNNTFTASGLWNLAANSTFWIVLKGIGTGSAAWNYTFGTVSGDGAADVTIRSLNSGSSWDPSATGQPFMMQVNATPASNVPEIDPSGVGSVMALVSGALGLLERRRSRKA